MGPGPYQGENPPTALGRTPGERTYQQEDEPPACQPNNSTSEALTCLHPPGDLNGVDL